MFWKNRWCLWKHTKKIPSVFWKNRWKTKKSLKTPKNRWKSKKSLKKNKKSLKKQKIVEKIVNFIIKWILRISDSDMSQGSRNCLSCFRIFCKATLVEMGKEMSNLAPTPCLFRGKNIWVATSKFGENFQVWWKHSDRQVSLNF